MTPSSQRMLASILLKNAGQPVRHPLQALSNIANTYFGYQALGRADQADDREALNKSMVLNQAIRAGRGWTNPDDTYTQLRQPIVKGVPIAQQPGAKIMSTPRNELGQKIPSVPGSQQAMADVLLGVGGKHPDLMKMGMNMYGQEAALQRAQEARKLQLGDMINKLELQSKLKDEENIGKELRKINNERIQYDLSPLTESDYLARTSVGAGPSVQRGDGQGKTLAEIKAAQELKKYARQEEIKKEVALKSKRKEERPQKRLSIKNKIDAIPSLEKNLNKAIRLSRSEFVGGNIGRAGALLSPSGDQRNLDVTVKQFKSLVGLDKLVAIKKEGGTLGALSESEMELLIATAGSLDTLADMDTLRENLRTVVNLYKKGIAGEINVFNEIYSDAIPFKNLESLQETVVEGAGKSAGELIELYSED